MRAGYGIFYSQAFYPGWNGGIAQDGFNTTPTLSSSVGGLSPAMILSQGFPSNLPSTPEIDATFLNGQGGPLYRPLNANRLQNAQQWNLTVDHQFGNNFSVSAAYVANKGTRLLSDVAPINTLNPSLLSMGQSTVRHFPTRPSQSRWSTCAISRMGGTNAGVRTIGSASTHAVSPVLFAASGGERECW